MKVVFPIFISLRNGGAYFFVSKVESCIDFPFHYEEKCKRALEELSHLADTIHRPGDDPKRGWPSKQEEIDTHLFNAVKMVLIVTNMSIGQRLPVRSEDIGCIVDEGYAGYEKIRDKFLK